MMNEEPQPTRRRGRPTAQITLSDDERQTLQRWARRHRSSQALALRCRIVLACAQGLSNVAVGEHMGVHPATVAKWRRRFATRRLEGLGDEPRPGVPRTITDTQVERVIVTILEEAPAGCHPLVDPVAGTGDRDEPDGGQPDLAGVWPQAAPGRDLEAVHRPAVHRQGPRPVWVVPEPARGGGGVVRGREVPDPGAGPHRAGAAADARQPPAAQPRLHPPWHHQPVRGAEPGLGPGHLADDPAPPGDRVPAVPGPCRPGDPRLVGRARDLRGLLHPQDPAIRRWLVAHPRFHVHFTPTYSSWLNLVERWFSELTTKWLKRGSHRSVPELTASIQAWIETWNEDPRPFVWTKTADQILDSIARYLQPTSNSGH